MCGIAGFLKSGWLGPETGADLASMALALAHRGPDDQGIWQDAQQGIAFCHRRLSIVDLSPLGHQPMTSVSGRYVITFNGEIYNHRALRAQLLSYGHGFRGGSDTEVLLAALEQWGLGETLRRAVGMFAFAVWDTRERTLHLARDRFGEKPLYYGRVGDFLLFGSELKALRAHSVWRSEINRDALTLLLRHGYIPAPYTIFRDVRKVRAGCVLDIRVSSGRFEMKEREYWSPSALPARSPSAQNRDATTELVEQVHEALRTAIRQQMVADVPVGAFLSGGIDSSLVVAMMQHESSQPVRTFSIGFAEQAFNEAPFARRVAEHLGTRHTELEVSSRDALEVIPRLPAIYDEPFADSSQIPTFLVSQLARRQVTVSLSGDGGDELFGGYSAYQAVLSRWQRIQRMPAPLRKLLASALGRAPLSALDLALRPLAGIGRKRGYVLADYLHERLPAAGATTLPHYYRAFMSIWNQPGKVVLGAVEPDTVFSDPAGWARDTDEYGHMMHVDARQYLPDDILVKVDRAAMAVSLETRVPLLDPAVAAAAWSIPTAVHLRDGRGKWVLRHLLERYVPRSLFDRPKKGFSVPVAHWLRNELKPWAADLLDPALLRRQGFFAADAIERRWRQHLAGEENCAPQLWAVLMFQQWLAHWQQESRVKAPAREPSMQERAALA